QGAIGYDAEAVITAGRKMLDLGHAVHRVIIGLARHRAVDAEPVADVADFGDAPGAIIRDAEIAHLAGADQFGHRAHGLLQRRRMVFLVQVIDVDVVGAEPLQALVAGLQDPAPRQPAAIGIVADLVGELGREDPARAAVGDGAADHLLGISLVVGVGRVDEVDAGLARLGDDPRRGRLVCRAAEHHGAEADRRNLQAAAAELTVLHLDALPVEPEHSACNSSLRAKRSNPESFRGHSLDCFVAGAPRDGDYPAVDKDLQTWQYPPTLSRGR